VAALRLGLEAASILLFIVTSPSIDPGVVSEDAVEACFTLLRHNLCKNLVPALNNTGHRLAVQKMEDEAGVSSGRKRTRRSTDGGESNLLVRELKKVYKFVATMVPQQIMLMARIAAAIQVMFLDDQLILTLTSGALDALEIEAAHSTQNPANRLQHATIDLITTAFKKFPAHRSTIIEDLFPLMLRLPASKRTMRACLVQYSSCPSKYSTQTLIASLYSTTLTDGHDPHYIQMITALLLSLIQCCVVRPTFGSTTNEEADKSNNQLLVSGLRGCQAVADIFASHMLQRCSRKGEDGGASEFRPILGNFVEDLLLVMMIPEYSAAQMVLLSCIHGLSRDIIIASRATSSSASDTVVETTYTNTAFDILGRTCAAYAKILRFQRDRELHKTVTVVPEDERHLRCYCKRNSFRDTLMIDCDNCHVWYQ
jgi:cohesin loading factor subunit SCC2